MNDFFISYNCADRTWATNLARWLNETGITYILQETDFVAGSNFVAKIHNALSDSERLLVVLSRDYLSAKYPAAEWMAKLTYDPTNEMRTIIPVRVDDCNPAGLLRPLVYIDLAGLPLLEARAKFIGDIMAALEGKAQLHPARSQKSKRRKKSGFNQTAVGTNNLLVGRDYNHYEQPPQENIIIQPGPECISSEQKKIIRDWIVKLADGSVGTSRAQSFSHWWSFFQNTFKVPKYELLKSIDFNSAIDWCRNQAAMQVRSLKKTAPDVWRNSRMASIHSARERKGIEKQIYYSDIARRLKMKKSFTSLKDLTNRDLERVYNMVLKDARDV